MNRRGAKKTTAEMALRDSLRGGSEDDGRRVVRDRPGLAQKPAGWMVAGVLGIAGGHLVGTGMTGTHAHAGWPALAGFVLGVVAALAAPGRRMLVAAASGGVAVAVAMAEIVAVQFERGLWPITDESTIAHYGTVAQATVRAAVVLGVDLIVPCLFGAGLVAGHDRWQRSHSRLPS